MCDKGSFPLVTIFDTNIELGEVASIFQLVHKVRDEGKRVCIVSGMFVEVVVILARAEFAILFLHKEEGGHLGGVQWTDLSSGQVSFKKVFHHLFLIQGERVDFANLWLKRLVEVDLVIIWSGGGNMVGGFFGEDLDEVSIF